MSEEQLDFSTNKILMVEHESENKVELYIPRCKKCNDRMVKWFYKMRADDRKIYDDIKSVTFDYDNLFLEMVFACKKHPSNNVKLDPKQLGILTKYLQHQVVYRNYPKH